MPSPLAPDPIRVQSCVCCLYWTNRNSKGVTSIFLSSSLSNQNYESFNQRYISKWKYLLLLKLWCNTLQTGRIFKSTVVNRTLPFLNCDLFKSTLTVRLILGVDKFWDIMFTSQISLNPVIYIVK